jgi:hypothetical protein
MGIEPGQLVPFIDRAFDGMVECVSQLGDGFVNESPNLPGANSPYAIVHHCVQLTHWWVGAMGAGRKMERDRDSEFTATGTLAELLAAVAGVRSELAADVVNLDPEAPVQRPDDLHVGSAARRWTRGEALIHCYEELAQHLGQLEITRDLLLVDRPRTA